MERKRWGVRWMPLLAALVVAVGCDDDNDPLGPDPIRGGGAAPDRIDAVYDWIFQGWDAGQPRGLPSVELSWRLPAGWNGEVFRVYARRAGERDYKLTATVTSCAEGECRYTDLNVQPSTTYEYFVTAVDESTRRESEGSELSRVVVPPTAAPQAPGAPVAVGLDGAVFLRWDPTGAERYWVVLETTGGEIFDVGETDGAGFLDTRAANGSRYRYRLAAVDTLGQVSALSPVTVAIPRPDHQAELLYAFADSAAASGFQFVAADSLNPIVPGGSAAAQLRLEVIDGALSLVPLGETTITSGVLTTALTCGPGSDPDCFAIGSATDPDAPTDFGASPVAVAAELTHLVRVRGSDGRTRFGKIRIALEGADQRGRDLVVFDWAYQPIPDEPSLNRR